MRHLVRALSLSLASSALLITGCGVGTTARPSDTTLPSLAGVVHGGQSPIQASTVTPYVTSATATTYGAAATVIGTATTDVNGSFTISPSATAANCPAGQQAYITAAGGYQSGQPTLVNKSMLLMAALGPCANINAATSVILNEITTVAAAYALSGFMTTSAVTGGLYAANVSSPVANNALLTGISATTPAGLAHAFTNAANLANYSNGTANTTVNSTSGGTTIVGHIPTAEINTLADAMQACVDGLTGNSNCTTLFGITPSISGIAPVNTLQAFINLARNPFPSSAAVADSTDFLGLAAASGAAFQPTLTTSPLDWSMAIPWNGGLAVATTYYLTVDASDTVYAGFSTLTASSTTPVMYGVSAYGNVAPTFGSASLATVTTTRGIAADSIGNVWINYNGSIADRFSTTTGTLASTYTTSGSSWPMAIDKQNNLWVGHVVSGSGSVVVDEAALSAGTYTKSTTFASNAANEGPYGLAIDAGQNIWPSSYYSSGVTATVGANTGTAAAPVYGTTVISATLGANAAGTAAIKPYNTVFDTSGNAYQTITGSNTTATTGFEEIIPSLTSGVITALNPQTEIVGTTVGSSAQGNTLGTTAAVYPAIDGAGTIFIPDNNTTSQGIHVYVTQSPTGLPSHILSPTTGFKGCNLSVSSTTCGTTSGAAVYSARAIAIDSTGSVWTNTTTTTTAPANVGGLTQIIGLAAPVYPLLSTGNWSLSPGLAAVATLP